MRTLLQGMRWSAALQTCPRGNIDDVVQGICRAGWTELSIYAEPKSVTPEGFCGDVYEWPRRLGDWTNWIAGLFVMFSSNPTSDYFVIFEDDIQILPNTRIYLEYLLPKLGDFGALSLYTPARQTFPTQRYPVLHDERWRGFRFWGGQAIVFSYDSLAEFLGSPDVLRYRRRDKSNGHKDTVLGIWAKRLSLPLYNHTPSLVEHLPGISLNNNTPHESFDFDEGIDVLQWIGKPLTIAPNLEDASRIKFL